MNSPHQSPTRRLVLLAASLSLCARAMAQTAPDTDSVTLDEARKEVDSGKATLFDVREPQETADGVAPGAKLLPLRQLAARFSEIPNDPKRPILLICRTQNRSSATFKFLREKGYTNVRFVQGGMSEWVRQGLQLVKP
ncbi:MAG: rhodanese-like domain-containing protein [Rhodoferax sp.]|nr:rhodanese-like domain-containing protein [Rhodoferax sp.]